MSQIKKVLRKWYDIYIKQDPKRIAFYDYIERGGEELRLDYVLDKNDVVLDVGGYIGDFAVAVSDKFGCQVDVFEPVAQYANEIEARVASKNNIHVIQAGLGGRDRTETITVEGLGSSVFIEGRDDEIKETIKIISIVDYIESKGYASIGLIKMNIEGGEFELFETIFEHPDLLKKIKYFQIQFHDFVPNAEAMRADIQYKLSQTHKKMWDFPFIWESWELKGE